MILSLIRASQVENWKLANGKVGVPPPPPPAWEEFSFLERYYGGLRTLKTQRENHPQYPPPTESIASDVEEAPVEEDLEARRQQSTTPSSQSWAQLLARGQDADVRRCFLDAGKSIQLPPVRYYAGRPTGFPENVVGSYEVLKLEGDVCFDRYGRYGPYGFGYSTRLGGLGIGEHGEKEDFESVWATTPRVDYRQVDWADVQRRCYEANAGRFVDLPARTPAPHGFYVHDAGNVAGLALRARGVPVNRTSDLVLDASPPADDATPPAPTSRPDRQHDTAPPARRRSRSAFVIRCWDEYLFREDDIASLRAIIAELVLGSGGRFDVHLLVQVKDDARHPIWADHEEYQKRIRDTIPPEFQGLVTLWTETQMLSLYQGIHDTWARGPDLPVHGVYRGLSMAMQYFAYNHPEYDFYWQWEMDVRYTGHYYDIVTKMEEWAKAQPRKGLWERSARFYFPSLHGTWEDFSQMSRVQTEMNAAGPDGLRKDVTGLDHGVAEAAATKGGKAVWGPLRPADEEDWLDTDKDPLPKTPPEKDRHRWGVGEEADYISLLPIFDPDGTTWGLRDDITGYNRSRPLPPRRAAMVTTARLSRRLLLAMHRSTAHKKQVAFPEMWPATVALHHGFKAVYAPHPVYVDRRWPVDYMARTYNGGRAGSSGGARTSVFGEREHNMRGLSWFYDSGFAPNLYRRWLGLKVNNDGGEEFEMVRDQSKAAAGVGNMAGGEGRMCLPPMLLHPVKDVELPVERPPDGEEELPLSDPSA